MNTIERKVWAAKIAEYILANGPVSLDALEARAKGHAWYTWNEFDAILLLLKKDTRISATLTKEGVIYKKKKEYVSPLLAERERVQEWVKTHYPRDEVDIDACPFKVCFCAIWRAEDGDIYNPEKHGHRPDCDSVRFPEMYTEQYKPVYART